MSMKRWQTENTALRCLAAAAFAVSWSSAGRLSRANPERARELFDPWR
jgi:hypothetical protein